MSDKYELKENRGNFFTENKVTVPRKGKCKMMWGTESVEKYGAILKYAGAEKDKYEFCVSLGLLHYNPPEKKIKEGTPDIGGKITIPEVDLEPIKKAISNIQIGQNISDIKSSLEDALTKITTEKVYKLGGWANISEKGTSYTSIKLTPEDEVVPTKQETQSDEDIPF